MSTNSTTSSNSVTPCDLVWEDMHIDDFQSLGSVLLPGAFDASVRARLSALAVRAQELESQGLQRRHGTDLHRKYYVHGLAAERDAELLELLSGAMKRADQWGFVRNSGTPVNVRLLEYHFYETGGDLTIGFTRHYDGGSLLTMVLMLSEPGVDFDGGVLSVSDEATWQYGTNETYRSVPLQHAGDAVVFPSHKFHNVSTVLRGKRSVAVMELWNEAAPTVVDDRPGGQIVINLNTAEQ
jgi:hypothetical protein